MLPEVLLFGRCFFFMGSRQDRRKYDFAAQKAVRAVRKLSGFHDRWRRVDPFSGPGKGRNQLGLLYRKLAECYLLNVEELSNPAEILLYIRIYLVLGQVDEGCRKIGKQAFEP